MSRRRIVVVALLVFASCAVYVNTLGNSFLWDDDDLIVKNQYIRDFKYLPMLFTPTFWRQREISMSQEISEKGADYRPLSMVAFACDYGIWRLNPAGYHATNMLLHALNVLLIYLFILKLGMRERLAIFTALFFAAHPIHTESVTWIKNRSEIIASLFLLWSFYLYIRHSREAFARPRLKYYAGSLICMIAALLSKETAIVLPILLMVYAALFVSREEKKNAMAGILSFMGLAILYMACKFYIFNASHGAAHASLGFIDRVLTVIKTFGIYVNLLTLPVSLNAERTFQIPHNFADPVVISSLITIILLLIISFKIRENRALTFGILWVIMAIIPISNIILLAARPVAEQRLYIPSIGFCLVLAAALEEIRSKKTVISLGILIFFLYSFATVTRNGDWKDSLTFWRAAVKASPRNAMAYNSLGLAYRDLGKDGEAIDNFKKAIKIRPEYSQAYNNIGVTIHAKTKDADEAIGYFRKAIEIDPGNAEAYNNLGALLFAKDRDIERAVLYCQKAVRLKPDYAEAYYNLGLFLDNQGKTEEAIRHYRKAAQLKPDYADAHINLGAAYRDTGDLEGSLKELSKALELKPEDVMVHKNLALTYEQMGNIGKANDHWKKVIEINPEDKQAKSKVSLQLESILSPQ